MRSELQKARVVINIRHPATTDRRYVLGRIEDIVKLDYLRAASIQRIGSTELMKRYALEGAEWVLTLDQYVHREYSDQKSRSYIYLERIHLGHERAVHSAVSRYIYGGGRRIWRALKPVVGTVLSDGSVAILFSSFSTSIAWN